jgi:hypothetical protein
MLDVRRRDKAADHRGKCQCNRSWPEHLDERADSLNLTFEARFIVGKHVDEVVEQISTRDITRLRRNFIILQDLLHYEARFSKVRMRGELVP